MRSALLAPLLLVAGCTTEIVDSTTTGHQEDPYTSLEREQREGPPRYTSRLHSCAKMHFATLGNVLASRGVNLAATPELSAGRIYRTSAVALGAANYAARTRENIELGVATASKIFDIYVQAAPEIMAAIPGRPECSRNGQPAQLFDSSNHCVESGFSCLIGMRATPAHLAVCDETIKRAADPESGKLLAIALLAAAAHTCE